MTRQKDIERLTAESAQTIAGLKAQARAIEAMGRELVRCLRRGKTVFAAGNGGSAAEATHLAEELIGRFRSARRPLPGVSLASDAAAITCIANDFGFDEVFSRQVIALGRPGDALVLFSTSGSSENLVRALKAAGKRGLKTICILGCGGGRMAGKAHHEVIVDSSSTARVQEAHQVIMHVLLEMVDEAFEK